MKSSNWKTTALAAVLATLPWLATGCGANNPEYTGNQVGTVPGGVVTPVVPVTPNNCIPINQPIAFSASGIYVDSQNILGGAIPANTAAGTAAMQKGTINHGAAPTLTPVPGDMGRNGSDAYLSMTVYLPSGAALPVPQYNLGLPMAASYYSGVANANGYLAVNQLAQTAIMVETGSGAIPCVSGVAMNLGYATIATLSPQLQYSLQGQIVPGSSRILYGGNVYLYLNGTPHGYRLVF